MVWKIEYSPRVVKAFKKDLDHEIVRRMVAKLEEAAALDDPTEMAKPMQGGLKGLWSYRIAGGYRVIADVQPDRLVILAVDAGPRRSVYER
ncbi:MAG: type II toxin-antitoxin system RelE/ParE family toxin [Rhodococcus sp.]|nr:type II toxin-antitoxin system RelE/ParE family toxin [Rhodococcus sp. (in: high G+C Gram-positive bacteria)]